MPWEDAARPFVARFLSTLGNALRPVRGAPSLCGIQVVPAFRFALLTAVPMMFAWGIVPFTETVLFKGGFQVELVSKKLPVWLDVLRAMGMSFAVSFLSQLAWALPFSSLLTAFAAAPVPRPLVKATAWRFVFYRAWLVPGCTALVMLLVCALPVAPPVLLIDVLRLVPQVLILLGAQAMALTFGASMLGSLAVALVPMILQAVVLLIASEYADQILPHLAQPPKP